MLASKVTSTDQRSALPVGLFFVAISIFFFIYSWHAISENTYSYLFLKQAQVEVILQNTGFLYYYGGSVIFFTLLLMGLYSLFLAFTGDFRRSLDRKIKKTMSTAIVFGFIVMISGKFIAQLYWTNEFEQAGYMECERSFGMTQSWTTKVWTTDPDICSRPFDPYPIWRKQTSIAEQQ